LFREFCDEFTREMNRLRMEGRSVLEAARAELGRIERQIKATVDAIADGMYHPSMKKSMDELESRKAELEQRLAHAEEPPLLHPEMATFYREQVAALHLALGAGEEEDRTEAAERLRSIVSKIVLTPEDGQLAVDVHGDLAGILAIAQAKVSSAGAGEAISQVKLVAGNRSQLNLQKKKGRPRRAANVADIVQQVKLVEGEDLGSNILQARPRKRANSHAMMVHRHADPLLAIQPAASVIEK
jgi:site-specific DNA recombinase